MRIYKEIPFNIREYFKYSETSPSGLVDLQGKPVGYKLKPKNSRTEYWVMWFKGKGYSSHRVIWYLQTGELSQTLSVDHLDGNGLNNTFSNLMEKTHRANCQNKNKQRNNSSGETGVYLNTKRSSSGRKFTYWMASWVDAHLVQRTKCFRIDKLGNEAAFIAATEHRTAMISTLTSQGQIYTERHGLH